MMKKSRKWLYYLSFQGYDLSFSSVLEVQWTEDTHKSSNFDKDIWFTWKFSWWLKPNKTIIIGSLMHQNKPKKLEPVGIPPSDEISPDGLT